MPNTSKSTAKPTSKKISDKKSVRLPLTIIPSKYVLTLAPDLEAHAFEGEEMIHITLLKAAKQIVLHSKELDIETVSITFGKSKTPVFASAIGYDEKNETVTFAFDQTIPEGFAILNIVFRGILNNSMRGFYRSEYVLDGQSRTMATTQFEATDARRAFPCFDEPAHKAIFEVTLVVPSDKTAISNTLPSVVAEHGAGYKRVTFAPTPIMSTYLLAFIVGDFAYLEATTNRGVVVRTYALPGKEHQTKFALDCAVRTLEFYEKYFAIKYPLNTLDMIAIPDFASGAMENWGAVTYRETAMLVDETETSLSNKQWVALVVAHELAHQWFGNLVTMEWWTHLWLNEGFASYIEYLAVNELFPEWHIWDQFAYADHGSALRLDALLHTHPIEVDVHHPDEIGEIFDEVSYSKGATVIRMLAAFLGEKNFRDGLRVYLKQHSYKNASTVHLWEAFEKVAKKPVRKMMEAWTKKPGYPVLSVAEKNNKFAITQSRFFASPLSRTKVNENTKWFVPISMIDSNGKEIQILSDKKSTTLEKKNAAWHKFNTNETGLYRVAYDAELLAQLAEPIRTKALPPIDRLGIIRDLFALAEAGEIETTTALAFLSNYTEETDHNVWIIIVSGLAKVGNLLANTDSFAAFEKFSQELLAPGVNLVGWEETKDEPHNTALLRPLVLGAASRFGLASVIREANLRFKNRTTQAIPADLRSMVYHSVVRSGAAAEYKTILSMYESAALHEEKIRLLSALAEQSDPKILAKTLTFGLSKGVRLQDRMYIFSSVVSSPKTRTAGWEFMKKNWSVFLKEYGTGGHLLPRFLKPLSGFVDVKMVKEVELFFKKNTAPGCERTLLQVLEQANCNAAWKKRDLQKISKFLKISNSSPVKHV